MGSGYGSLSQPSATSDEYKDGWERIYGKKKAEPEDRKQAKPQTIDAYKVLAQRDLNLIMEMKGIIGTQNKELNQLRQKVKQLTNGRKVEP